MKEQELIFYLTENSIDDLEDIIFTILTHISKEHKYARLILEEWLVNIMKYSNTKENKVVVLINNPHSITTIDSGIPFDITKYPPKEMNIWTIGGKGIFLIRELSTALIYEYKNNSNNLTIQF